MRKYLVFLLIFQVSISRAQIKTPEEMASFLVEIGDSVHQANLSPLEKYNRYSPFDRSYLAVSVPFSAEDNNLASMYRVDFFHKIGFYLTLPYAYNTAIESNTTIEEIQYSEGIADLQGQEYLPSNSIGTDDGFSALDVGINYAPWSKNPLLKNVYVSFGVVVFSEFEITYVSNNGLLGIEGDFIVIEDGGYALRPELVVKYVLPFINAGVSYRHSTVYPGVYYSLGVNVPLKKVQSLYSIRKKESERYRKKLNQLDNDAKDFNTSNFK